MSEPQFRLEAGPVVEVPRERSDQATARMDEVIRLAKLSGAHVWTAVASWLVADPGAVMRGETPLIMDTENLAYGPGIVCFRCEQTYSERVVKRRCRDA